MLQKTIIFIIILSFNINNLFSQNVSFEYNEAGEMVKIERYYLLPPLIPFYFNVVSTKNDDITSKIVLYPNPVKEYLNIELPYNKSNYTIELTDIQGQKLQTIKHVNDNIQINLKKYPSGIYLISIYSDEKCEIFKISKTN